MKELPPGQEKRFPGKFKVFKVWCKTEKQWEKHECLLTNKGILYQMVGKNLIKCNPDTHLIFFFTGLYDKKGMPIFEGDFIKHPQYNRPYSISRKSCDVISLVTWFDGGSAPHYQQPCFQGYEIKNEKGYGYGDWSEFFRCEVIGNICENLELLEI